MITLNKTKFGLSITAKDEDGQTCTFAERNASERQTFNMLLVAFTENEIKEAMEKGEYIKNDELPQA